MSLVPTGDEDEPLFSHTDLQKVYIQVAPPEPEFGILDFQPNSVTSPPVFTEKATLAAMRNLNVEAKDLVPMDLLDSGRDDNSVMRLQVTIELERRRFETIEKIITERNKILANPEEQIQIKLPTSKTEASPTKKLRKRKKTGKKKVSKKTPKEEKPSPRIKKTKPAPKKCCKSPSVRKIPNPNVRMQQPNFEIIAKRRRDALLIKQKREEELRILAEKASARVQEAEKRQEELRRKKQEEIRKRAEVRMARLKGEETNMEKIRRERKEQAEAELQRKERTYMRLQEKKKKKFEEEQKWRREKIYGEKKEDKNRFSQLRKKFIEAQQTHGFSTQNEAKPPPVQAAPQQSKPKSVQKIEQKIVAKEPTSVSPPMLPTNKKTTKPSSNKTVSSLPVNPTKAINNPPKPANSRNSQSKISRPLRCIVRLPVVGKGRTRIPCLRA